MRVGSYGVGAAGGGCPAELAWPGLLEFPAGVLFQLVVSAAGAAEVAGTGPATVVVVQGVVQVGTPGWLPADRAAAGHVPGGHLLSDPGRGPVGRRLGCGSAASRSLVRLLPGPDPPDPAACPAGRV